MAELSFSLFCSVLLCSALFLGYQQLLLNECRLALISNRLLQADDGAPVPKDRHTDRREAGQLVVGNFKK